MGLIEVSPTTDPQRAAAIRERLMNPPKRQAVAKVIQFPIPAPVISKDDMATHEMRIMGFVRDMEDKPKMRDVIIRMCGHYRYGAASILGCDRRYDVTLVRQKVMWVLSNLFPDKSVSAIGRAMNKDHTTILHGVGKINGLIAANDPRVADLKEWVKA